MLISDANKRLISAWWGVRGYFHPTLGALPELILKGIGARSRWPLGRVATSNGRCHPGSGTGDPEADAAAALCATDRPPSVRGKEGRKMVDCCWKWLGLYLLLAASLLHWCAAAEKVALVDVLLMDAQRGWSAEFGFKSGSNYRLQGTVLAPGSGQGNEGLCAFPKHNPDSLEGSLILVSVALRPSQDA